MYNILLNNKTIDDLVLKLNIQMLYLNHPEQPPNYPQDIHNHFLYKHYYF